MCIEVKTRRMVCKANIIGDAPKNIFNLATEQLSSILILHYLLKSKQSKHAHYQTRSRHGILFGKYLTSRRMKLMSACK